MRHLESAASGDSHISGETRLSCRTCMLTCAIPSCTCHSSSVLQVTWELHHPHHMTGSGETRLVLHIPSSSWAGKRLNYFYYFYYYYITCSEMTCSLCIPEFWGVHAVPGGSILFLYSDKPPCVSRGRHQAGSRYTNNWLCMQSI